MARYGLDYYSASSFPLSYYGNDNALNYDANPVFALSSGYNQLTLFWTSPVGAWVKLRLVRSPYGFPVNVTDGDKVFETTRRADPQFYIDKTSLINADSKVYFYSIFVFDSVQLTWVLAGRMSGMSVKDYGTADKMYNYLPQVYKLTTPYVASEATDNNDLRNFLSLFAYELDHTRALAEIITDRYNFERVTASSIPLLLNQFGLRYEPEIGFQQSRILVRDSVQLTKEKGSAQGLREYIKGFTGWACPAPVAGTPNPTIDGLQVSHNLMLDYNDSSFEEGVGHWTTPDNTASLSQMGVKSVTKYQTNNNNLRMIVGANGYKIGDKITISGFKSPAYNSSSPVSITGVDPLSYIEVIVSSPDVALVDAFNKEADAYPKVTPYPTPYSEPTAPALYPNKQGGVLSVANSTASPQVVTLSCGSASPKTLGIPINSGDTYTFSIYTAALSTARSLTAGISWYDRFGTFMSTTTGNPVTNATGAFSTRAVVTAAGPCNITLNPFFATAGTGYADGVYTNVPLTRVSGKAFTIAPRANIAISGGSVSSLSITNGGKGSDTTTIFSFDKASIGSATGSGFLATVNRVQESYYAAPTISISSVANAASGERHYFDAAQFEKAGAVTDFDEARQVHITMKASRINEIKNPTFNSANSFAPWGFTNGTPTASTAQTDPIDDLLIIEGYQQTGTTAEISLSTVHAYKANDIVVVAGLPAAYNGVKTITAVTDFTVSYTVSPSATVAFTADAGTIAKSGNSCLVTKPATGNTEINAASSSATYMDIHYPSTNYTFSVYVRRVTGTAAPTVRPVIYWYDSTKTAISSNLADLVTISSSTEWSRINATSVAPENAAYASVSVIWTNGAANDSIALDNALFENSPFVLQYFDGSQGFGSTAELFWEGQTPNLARSHYYRNRVAISDRLAKGALDEWLVSGSTYALYLAQPKT
jgi:hypothetical protein